LASTRDAGAPPTSPPWGSGDYTSAVAIYAAITTALYHRERTGRGANVGTSLLATGVWATGTLVSAALAGGKPYELHDRNTPVNAMTNAYQSEDERWIMLAAKRSAWPVLANAIGRSDLLSDPRFSDAQAVGQHAAELAALLDAEFRAQPLAHWKEVLDEARIPYGVIQTPEEAAEDPQLRAADIVVPIEGARDLEYTVNNPITLRGLDRVPSRRAPEHGEHNDDILAQLGFSVDDIAQLREQKVIPTAPEQETVK
jgi:formyl-CoA transferase